MLVCLVQVIKLSMLAGFAHHRAYTLGTPMLLQNSHVLTYYITILLLYLKMVDVTGIIMFIWYE